ncbi:MAG: hypothetical protein F4X82_01805 [Candidatus Spechtbacteria bacterium SB0662_bin_43]|uniref:Uncharacterized protein n=1 Tax=Candidatus Spechtbacteria bacterium SB0662_bin_43 TaxID=2604897 RepID=A0A845DA55_9BACT|nr:hypothetical protein [Candidatus Spechtbacteria bacterium SB0662_bin_43]
MVGKSFIASVENLTSNDYSASSETAREELISVINQKKDELAERIRNRVSKDYFLASERGSFTASTETDFNQRKIELPNDAIGGVSRVVLNLSVGGNERNIYPAIEDTGIGAIVELTEDQIKEYAGRFPEEVRYSFQGNDIFILSDFSFGGEDGDGYIISYEKYPANYKLKDFSISEDLSTVEGSLPRTTHTALLNTVISEIISSDENSYRVGYITTREQIAERSVELMIQNMKKRNRTTVLRPPRVRARRDLLT